MHKSTPQNGGKIKYFISLSFWGEKRAKVENEEIVISRYKTRILTCKRCRKSGLRVRVGV